MKKIDLQDDDLNIFTQLGLTHLETEVYIAIIKSGQSTASSIAKKLQIARAEVYRIIPELLKLGLIERIITTPNAFRAFPISMGLNTLLERNKKRQDKIQTEAKEFLRKFRAPRRGGGGKPRRARICYSIRMGSGEARAY
jgi:sugar-specific transcriptional regulator TrmB